VSDYTAQDVRDLVVTLLQDSSSGFDIQIATINTARSHTAPITNSITYKWGQNQYPFIFVDVDSSEVQTEDLTLPSTLSNLPVVHTVNVMGTLKYANDNVQDWAEDWIEAILKVLHNYNDSNVNWIFWTNTERAELYSKMNERLKTFLVSFEVRVN
jgi:hypothetical protein